MSSRFFALFFLCTYLSLCSCSYFLLRENTPRCFLEEIPVDTLVTIRFKISSPSEDMAIEVTVKDPNDGIMMEK